MERAISAHQHHTFRLSDPLHLLHNWVYSRDLHGCCKAIGILLYFHITHHRLFTVHLLKVQQQMTRFHCPLMALELSKASSFCLQRVLCDSWSFPFCLSETTVWNIILSLCEYGLDKPQDSKMKSKDCKLGIKCKYHYIIKKKIK